MSDGLRADIGGSRAQFALPSNGRCGSIDVLEAGLHGSALQAVRRLIDTGPYLARVATRTIVHPDQAFVGSPVLAERQP